MKMNTMLESGKNTVLCVNRLESKLISPTNRGSTLITGRLPISRVDGYARSGLEVATLDPVNLKSDRTEKQASNYLNVNLMRVGRTNSNTPANQDKSRDQSSCGEKYSTN